MLIWDVIRRWSWWFKGWESPNLPAGSAAVLVKKPQLHFSSSMYIAVITKANSKILIFTVFLSYSFHKGSFVTPFVTVQTHPWAVPLLLPKPRTGARCGWPRGQGRWPWARREGSIGSVLGGFKPRLNPALGFTALKSVPEFYHYRGN